MWASVVKLQEKLKVYAGLRNNLELQAQEEKDKVRKVFEEQGQALRNRERQLLRQVDVLTAHQMSLYLVHHATLHQLLGSAKTAQIAMASVEDPSKHNQLAALKEKIIESLNQLPNEVNHAPPLMSSYDSSALMEAIQGFGRIQSTAIFPRLDGKASLLLPFSHEEYNEVPEDLLQSKPLMGTPSMIRFSFPRPSSLEKHQWLLNTNCFQKETEKKGEKTGKSGDLEHWLAQLKHTPEADEEPESDFVNIHRDSEPSESIEVISTSEVPSIPNSTKGYACNCASPPEEVEIENLDTINCLQESSECAILHSFCQNLGEKCNKLEECCMGEERHCIRQALSKKTHDIWLLKTQERCVELPASGKDFRVKLEALQKDGSHSWLLRRSLRETQEMKSDAQVVQEAAAKPNLNNWLLRPGAPQCEVRCVNDTKKERNAEWSWRLTGKDEAEQDEAKGDDAKEGEAKQEEVKQGDAKEGMVVQLAMKDMLRSYMQSRGNRNWLKGGPVKPISASPIRVWLLSQQI
ncbi:unnamed protein product [Darwinula stevensoni]|uniref:Nuclear receptor coactivator 4 n=1 Tax=Darwinula stevensoni TaxID=69355 RepID=A0A7R9A4F0_9CRUS|nr:unnamed protein product [Darwinula stevensoni]CAG0884143.1 unnamed protein product [Darwinula stevensoni]